MQNNKVAIISGASRGIGRKIAVDCAQAGMNIAFNYHSSREAAQKLVAEIEKNGVKATAYQVDSADHMAVTAWVAQVREEFGTIDIVINNAGITRDKSLMFMEHADWQDVIDTNMGGMYNLTRAAITTMLKKKSGCIINITSVSGIIGLPRQTNYSASKAGIIGFTKALAKEVAGYGIRVNAVAPGFVETDMIDSLNEKFMTAMKARIPLARFGTVEDVSRAVGFLISDRASYITGQVLVVDGGLAI